MSFRFVMLKGATSPHDNGTLLTLKQAHTPAIGASLLLTQVVSLLSGRHLQRACQQSTYGSHRDLFHLVEVDIETGTLLAPMLPHDDFSPTSRQFLDVLEVFRSELARCHVASMQRDRIVSPSEILT